MQPRTLNWEEHSRQWRVIALALMALAVIAFSAISAPPAHAAKPPQYFVDESKLPFTSLPGTQTTTLWGVQGGAGYRVEVPANWNGDLVLYAHGFRGTGLELTVSNPSIRAYLIANGYAWAASSYSTNGYDVSQGVKDTHNLGKRFNGLVGKPDKTYIMGQSMGGHITGVLAEQHAKSYAGALPMCGVMGDNELFDYFVDFQLIAQAITGIEADHPFPADYGTTTVPLLKAALGPAYPLALNANGQALKAATINNSGGARPLTDVAFASWGNFLFDQGQTFEEGSVENENTVYQLDSDPALSPAEQVLNNSVQRISLHPSSRHPNGLGGIPAISGNIRIPVLSIHTLGDLFVPFSMEQIYAQRVADNGKSDLLVVRAIRDVGHCGFTVDEQANAFADLVNWVENGVKPAGDDVLTPATVADPNFGCTFTTAKRSYAPACP